MTNGREEHEAGVSSALAILDGLGYKDAIQGGRLFEILMSLFDVVGLHCESLMDQPGEITQMLREWGVGKPVDESHLFEMLYPQLRGLAASLMQKEKRGHLLQPTGVVNELFLKLVQQRKLEFNNREHFYSFAARLMRRILVDFARSQGRVKRDGGQAIPLTDDMLWADVAPEATLDLDTALSDLDALDARKCRMIELRFVLGFTADETADLMGLSKASVDRDLRFARSWLQTRLSPSTVRA